MNVSTAPSSWTIEWSYHRQLVQKADALGFEILVPVARWRGMGGETDYTGENYETFTYASAVAASTENIMTVGTVHAPIIPSARRPPRRGPRSTTSRAAASR